MSFKSVAERLFSKDKHQLESAKNASLATADSREFPEVELFAPLSGTVLELKDVADQTFASGALGPGVALNPVEGKLVAPADGTVTVAFPTGHAIGLRLEDGVEVLIHVGFDTVELDGKFFNPVVEKGQEVKCGDTLVEFDIAGIAEAGYPLVTPMVITNAKDLNAEIVFSPGVVSGATVNAGDALLQTSQKISS